MLIVVSMADIGAALLLGTIAAIFVAFSFADFSSQDNHDDEPRVGGILVSLVPAAFAILGFVFAVAVWRGKAKFQWAAWNLAYLVLVVGAAFLFLGLLDKLRSGWLAIALMPVVGCIACAAAMVLQKKSQREAAVTCIQHTDLESRASSEREPSTDYTVVYRSGEVQP